MVNTANWCDSVEPIYNQRFVVKRISHKGLEITELCGKLILTQVIFIILQVMKNIVNDNQIVFHSV